MKILFYAILFLFANTTQGEPAMSKIEACPDKPNCVYSLGTTDYSKIEPLGFYKSTQETEALILKIMKNLPRTTLIKNEGNYLHFTTKSKWIKFTDDVEFYIDEKNKVTQIKSASRTGHSDFSVNRKRVENIRSQWYALVDKESSQ